MFLTQLIAPAPTRQCVEDDGVDVTPVIETGIEVQGDVVGIVTNVDGEAATEAENTEVRGVEWESGRKSKLPSCGQLWDRVH